MAIADFMTRDVRVISPDRSVREAARLMDDLNVGVVPVCDGQRLVGMVTDRDITVRATAAGLDPDTTRVSEVMTAEVEWCFEDDPVEDVVERMSRRQIRRIPVVDREKHLVGIVALGDLVEDRAPGAEDAMRRISSPSEPDRSGTLTTARADQTRRREPDPLTQDERRELDRRMRAPDRNAGADLFAGASDVGGRGGREGIGGGPRDRGGPRSGFQPNDEDDIRAAFPGGFNQPYGEGEDVSDGRMPGGFGGEGYNNYGDAADEELRGAQGGGAAGPAGPESHGSNDDGTPHRYGYSGEENYDRGVESAADRRADRDRHLGGPHGGAVFSTDTEDAGEEPGRDPAPGAPRPGDPPETGTTGGVAGVNAGSPAGGRSST